MECDWNPLFIDEPSTPKERKTFFPEKLTNEIPLNSSWGLKCANQNANKSNNKIVFEIKFNWLLD